ncbi:MAG: Lrp/AsnC family transcriptional regulator [Thaumarchaeota archaeon]|nr:Lrp/AsnC family transcriptional regulator [Nitrososphaerota archaeon]
MEQHIVEHLDHDEMIKNYTLNTTYVLITCDVGKEELILKKIATLKPISEIQRTMGQYDIIVKFEGMNEMDLTELIDKEIRSMRTVRSVMTLKSVSMA